MNIRLSDLTASSVVVQWDTDEPATSKVEYGVTDNYGSSKTDLTLKEQHRVSLTGLSPETAYHYRVVSADAAGNTTFSQDNTFLTPVSDALPPTGTGQAPAPVISTGPGEKTPPTITITTRLNQPFQEPPTISGRASGEQSITRVDYSLDNGRNWLPVDSARGLGTKAVTFTFRPLVSDDGNYLLLARAIDTVGARGVSPPVTLIIDRMPPIIGGNMISIGPQILQPDREGTLHTLARVDQKITLSAGGGPVSITIVATNTKENVSQLFTLTRSDQTGLWSGILSFQKPGGYSLIAEAVDGAGRRTERTLNAVAVEPPATVIQQGTNDPIPHASITLFSLTPDLNTWTVWDGAPFGQANPQSTDDSGEFRYLLPPGRYYLKAQAPNHRPLISNIFVLDKPTPLVTTLAMPKLTLPFFARTVSIDTLTADISRPFAVGTLLNQTLPTLSLPSTNGQTVTSQAWRGKPTVLTFLATWSPAAKEQFSILNEIQPTPEYYVVPITTLEGQAKVKAYLTIAHYSLDVLIDQSGTTLEPFNIQSLPTHYFVDGEGRVKKIFVGVLSKEEMLEHLSEL